MIYCDNSATTLKKPPAVREAVAQGIDTFGNPGRSFYSHAMLAAHAVYGAREEIARMVGLSDPLRVAVTSGATESLGLVLGSLIGPGDGVITSVLEHNSVLRPLYRIGCPLSYLDCDEEGTLLLDELPGLIDESTRFVVCTHGSNLVGSITDAQRLYSLCREHGLTLILDVSQTLGSVKVSADMADILCFTGHKALMGPQGTGGIIVEGELPLRLAKTGGTGSNTFDAHQPLVMPDLFEAGTHNAHGLAGLQAGAAFVNARGIPTVTAREETLTARFLEGIRGIPGLTLYGPRASFGRVPVVALNLAGIPSEDVALRLWESWEIATRAGSHCAPLAHKRFGTVDQGMVRFSFGWYNTLEEIDAVVGALTQIAKDA